jgi:hypothetical protein
VPRPLLSLLAVTAAVLAACGSPPRPLPTAPPPARVSAFPSAQPSLPGLPTTVVTPPPIAGPPPTYPTLPPAATTRPPATTPPTTGPKPAARCTSGPTGAQVLAAVAGRPGIPDTQLDVHAGPYCSGSWQFTELELSGKTADQVDPLLVVTTGKPAALTVVEAGADVCSDQVQQAPAGIRVRACGF